VASIKRIFFDIDDTLVDHATAMRAATILLYESLHLEATITSLGALRPLVHRLSQGAGR
jgi:FMN phosphatase YigB (HAD superfamily)